MQKRDFLIVAFFPLAVLLIPLVAMQFTREVNWTLSDFVIMWVVLSIPTFLFRLLVTRKGIGLAYKLGAALSVVAGFLITWVNLAVQIIGDDNPGNVFYFLIILGGMIGVGASRLQPAGLSKVAFSMAGALLIVPVIAVQLWPADFNPGFARVFLLNLGFVLMFATAGLLFRHAAGGASTARPPKQPDIAG